VVAEKVQHSHAPSHFYFRLHLHRGPHIAGPIHCRAQAQGEGLHGERGGHVLSPAGGDLAGGDEHESDLRAVVEKLERAVVVGEGAAVRVADGGVLREREVDGAVSGGEGRDLDSADADFGVLRLEQREVNEEDDDEEEDQENGGHETRGEVRAVLGLGHGWVLELQRKYLSDVMKMMDAPK